jgi:hypothetical protein
MTRSISNWRGKARWIIALIAAALCAALSAIPLTARAAPAAGASPDPGAGISVNLAGATTGDMTSHYMGLSVESSTLSNGYRYDAVGNLPQLLKNLGSGVIRFGGNSADTGFTGVTKAEAASVARLTKATGWKVIYTESLLHFNAKREAADAKLVHKTLGSGLDAFACGNEPDQYSAEHVKPASYSVASYLSQVSTCYKAIRAGAPGAPIEGPDIAWQASWLSAYAAKEKGAARFLGAHYYPLGCAKAGTSAASAAATLESASLARAEVKRLSADETIAHKVGKPVRITETNSACAGGVKGASNAYATALWVIDYMLAGARLGVAGMNFHGGLNTLCGGYSVLCQVGTSEYRPQPIYYGMLFTRLFGTGGFLPVTLSSAATARHVVAFADKGGKDRMMLEDMGSQAAPVTLHLNGYKGTSVQVLHLTGGSLLATSGVKIQGASVAANGTLTPGSPDTVTCKLATCSLTLEPYSAALVTLD